MSDNITYPAGVLLRQLREQHAPETSQADIARALKAALGDEVKGISRQFVHRVEIGERRMSGERLMAWVEALDITGIDVWDLLEEHAGINRQFTRDRLQVEFVASASLDADSPAKVA